MYSCKLKMFKGGEGYVCIKQYCGKLALKMWILKPTTTSSFFFVVVAVDAVVVVIKLALPFLLPLYVGDEYY